MPKMGEETLLRILKGLRLVFHLKIVSVGLYEII